MRRCTCRHWLLAVLNLTMLCRKRSWPVFWQLEIWKHITSLWPCCAEKEVGLYFGNLKFGSILLPSEQLRNTTTGKKKASVRVFSVYENMLKYHRKLYYGLEMEQTCIRYTYISLKMIETAWNEYTCISYWKVLYGGRIYHSSVVRASEF